jgi:putative colanic acid biosynthesis UDP-glucose lipid carrier transferase
LLYHEFVKRGHFPKYYSWLSSLWLALDMAVAVCAFFATLVAFDVALDHPFIPACLLIMSCIFFIYPLMELFSRIRTRPITQEINYLFKAWCKVLALLLVVAYVTGHIHFYPVKVVVLWAAVAYAAQLGLHLGVRTILNALRKRGFNIRYALMVGTRDCSRQFHQHLLANEWMGIKVLGYLSEPAWEEGTEPATAADSLPLFGGLDNLQQVIESLSIGELFITLPAEESVHVEAVAKKLLNFPVNTYWIPCASLPTHLRHYVSSIDGNPVICLSDSPMRKGPQFLKRALDVIFSTILLLLLAPLLGLIALAIKCSSPGPVIYKQPRAGLFGEEIAMWKFRTMHVLQAGEVEKQATRTDSRITPIGGFLRRWSLDELPQLVNVLQGNMSIVGPRPHPLWLNEQYRGKLDAYMLRHHVKPGITGWAQVNGLRGETDTPAKMLKRLEFDLYYINNWSIFLDLKILLLTVRAVLNRENAF